MFFKRKRVGVFAPLIVSALATIAILKSIQDEEKVVSKSAVISKASSDADFRPAYDGGVKRKWKVKTDAGQDVAPLIVKLVGWSKYWRKQEIC